MNPEKNPKNRMRGIRGVTLTALAILAAGCSGLNNQPAVESQPINIEADGSNEVVLTPEERKAKERELAEFETLIREYIDTNVDREYWDGVFNLKFASDQDLSRQFVAEPHRGQDGVDYYIRFPFPELKPSVFFSFVRNSQGEIFALIYQDKRSFGNMSQEVPGRGIRGSRLSVDRENDPIIDLRLLINMPIRNMPVGLLNTPWEPNGIVNEEQHALFGSNTGIERTYDAPGGTHYHQTIEKNGERSYSFFNREKADQ